MVQSKTYMVGGMPISGVDDFSVMVTEELNVLVDDGNDFVAISNGKSSAWAEIVLNVNHYQKRMLANFNQHTSPANTSLK
jgi:hypothetical protein